MAISFFPLRVPPAVRLTLPTFLQPPSPASPSPQGGPFSAGLSLPTFNGSGLSLPSFGLGQGLRLPSLGSTNMSFAPTLRPTSANQPRTSGLAALPPLTPSPPSPAGGAVSRWRPQAELASRETGVPVDVLLGLIDIESSGNPDAYRSDTRATGLGQIVGGPRDPTENVRAMASLLREKQRAWGIDANDWDSTAAAYFGAYNGRHVTGATDATGTNGYSYVQKFQAARQRYAASSPAPSTDAISRVQPLLSARAPYVYGGKDPASGLDCSGFVGFAYGLGPQSTLTLYARSTPSSSPQRGDLVFYNMNQTDMSLQHVGIYQGDGTILQQGGSARYVNVADVNQHIGTPPEFRRLV